MHEAELEKRKGKWLQVVSQKTKQNHKTHQRFYDSDAI